MAKEQVMEKTAAAVRDALGHARVATQELHQAISGILAKGARATKAEVEGVIQKAKAAADSAMRARQEVHQEAIKKQLSEAIDKLQAAEKHATESLRNSGEAFHASLGKALADARASVQKISEAVAARRSEQAAKRAPVKKAS